MAKPPALTIGETARRIGLLRGAVEMLGSTRAAASLGIEPRSLRAKLEVSRGVSDDNLHFIATALDQLAAEAAAHATKIRANISGRKDAA